MTFLIYKLTKTLFPDVLDVDSLPAPVPPPTPSVDNDHSGIMGALKSHLKGLVYEGLKEALTALIDVLEAINAENAVPNSTLSRQLWAHYLPLLLKYLDKLKSVDCTTENISSFYLEIINFVNTLTNSCYEILDGIYENELMDIKAETKVLGQLATAERKMSRNVYN